jgi:hypothetical protein
MTSTVSPIMIAATRSPGFNPSGCIPHGADGGGRSQTSRFVTLAALVTVVRRGAGRL